MSKKNRSIQNRDSHDRERARAEREFRRAEREGREPADWALAIIVAESQPQSAIEQLGEGQAEAENPEIISEPEQSESVASENQISEHTEPDLSEAALTNSLEREDSIERPIAQNVEEPELTEITQEQVSSIEEPQLQQEEVEAVINPAESAAEQFFGPTRLQTERMTVKNKRKGNGRKILMVVLLGFVALILWFLSALFQPFAGPGKGEVSVKIPAGASTKEIGSLLAKRDVIDSGLFFSFRTTLSGKLNDLKPGEYVLKRDMSYSAVLDTLSEGPKPEFVKITIPEGKSRKETAQLLASYKLKGDYLVASKRSSKLNPRKYGAPKRTRSLEGFLFPATYEMSSSGSSKRLVGEQLEAFQQRFDDINLNYAKSKNLTPYEVITIASMIEREAQQPGERKLIAAVIYNRLAQGMPLGIDATIRFANDNWTKPLTNSELAIKSPYNTRTRKGLPPTPIGSPGLASLKAAARPAKVDYLYYVVKPGTCGKHAFSRTDAEFQQDVKRYQKAREQNGGKSPTEC